MSSPMKQNWLPVRSGQETGGRSLRVFLLLVLQLALTGALLFAYGIEAANGMNILLPFFCGAILVHYWLPAHFRPAWFTIAGWTCLFYALGWISGGLTIAIALCFFTCAHLPLRAWFRAAIALAITGALIAVRMQLVYMPHILVAVPVLGSMLMFRFILYMYELKHEKQKASWTERLSYFFNPVNLVFPLFPILDYKTWLRSIYNDSAEKIYARATRRILLGIFQLLAYRWIYLHLPNPSNLQTANELLIFIFGGYALIFRMLGIFWIAIGLLGYFGYNLPPVFENAFFITGFHEIWRKINIYWRDFITKVFYYEIYFKLRKRIKNAVFASTLIAFVITWLLHDWQWFWLRGDFSFRLTDMLYWLLLGTFISLALAREEKAGAKKQESKSYAASVVFMLRVLAMYFAMSFLWTLWNSATVSEWFFLLGKIAHEPAGALPTISILAGIVLAGALLRYLVVNRQKMPQLSAQGTLILTAASAILLLLPFWKTAAVALPPAAAAVFADVSKQKLNQQDRENTEQGYYEMLVDGRGESPWEQHVNVHGRGQWFSKAELPANDIRKRTLRPSVKIVNGASTFTTNRWGMRSPECDTAKPKNVFRIAVLGSSYEMGSGVSDEEVFVRILEKKLNDSLIRAGDSLRVEILNFSAGGYHMPQYAWICDNMAKKFHPDILLCFAHSDELRRLNAVMAGMVKNGADLYFSYLESVKEKTGVNQKMSRTEIRNRLQPVTDSIHGWSLGHIARSFPSFKFWIYLPSLNSPGPDGEFEKLEKRATAAGFIPLSLRGVYGKYTEDELQVQPNDNHPNATGHQLIGDALYNEFAWQVGRIVALQRVSQNNKPPF
ncbi:MAG: hypothetical protein FD123_1018 [Bacteroidetes bacterium]|nr:MAG: hypothetical protein FD123_1018 [Bacteroidota bacterium]